MNFYPLYTHQRKALKLLQEWDNTPLHGFKGGILAFKMGLGKTRTILELIYDYKNNNKKIFPSLVVCTKTNIHVWEDEINKFYSDKLTYLMLYPDNIKLSQQTILKYDIIITTYEIVRSHFNKSEPSCFYNINTEKYYTEREKIKGAKYDIIKTDTVKKYSPIYSTKWIRIIVDETHRLNNPTTDIYSATMALKAESYFCVTGTPLINYSNDIYALFKFMGFNKLTKKQWTESNYNKYKLSSRIIATNYMDTDINYATIENNFIFAYFNTQEKQIYEKLRSKINDNRECQLNVIKNLKNHTISPYLLNDKADTLLDDKELISYIKNKENSYNSSRVIKCIRKIKEILEKKEKVVVFSGSVVLLKDILSTTLNENRIEYCMLTGTVASNDRKKMCHKFNNSETCNVLLSTYAVGGYGINLSSANHIILFDPCWNNAIEEQAVHRCQRIGQLKKQIFVYTIIVTNSIDKFLIKTQNDKNDVAKKYIPNYSSLYSEEPSVNDLAKHLGKSFK